MHQRPETIHPERKASSINRHLNNGWRQKSLRQTYSRGLPLLVKETVNMVAKTLQLTNSMAVVNEHTIERNHEQEENDDSDNDRLDIGQNVQAHIPDIVLNNLSDLIDRKGLISIPNEHKYDHSTLLFLDVSGFTSLTEQYSNATNLGIDQLTRTLNSYFEKVVFEILTHGGDIYKFAGDAILALWTKETMGPQQALTCALQLQQECGAYETDVGVILRLKVALAYGPVCAIFVGIDEFKHYLLTGNCVKDVNMCEQLCEPGDIILTKAVYERLQSIPFDCKFVPVSEDIDPKHEHIAVKYSQAKPSSDSDSDSNEHMKNSTVMHDKRDTLNQDIVLDNNYNDLSDHNLSNDELNLKINVLIKSFLLHCVRQRIERKQSLDYLSELRRVTISFINLDITNEHTINDNLHENINKIFVQIYESTKMMGGVLTKALLFDKGFSFLCVFGLPGYKQGDDTANALKCAQMIHSTIREQCQFVDKCSIGVTTGLTYCGVVGHEARCEYTVIGRKVNMAARLMCNYPNLISCDQETYYNSRLISRLFQKLPAKTLKGMTNVGVIWQYGDYPDVPQIIESSRTLSLQFNEIKQENYPLLGRRMELMIVAAQIMLLDEPVNSKNRRRDLAALIFEGEDKIGRSRLLQFIANALESSTNVHNSPAFTYSNETYIPTDTTRNSNNNILPINANVPEPRSSITTNASDLGVNKKLSIQVINYRCQFEQRFNEFGLLRSLLRQLLQFQNDKSQYECEQYLLRLFDINKANDLHLRRNLFLLNDLLDVRFRRSHIETDSVNETNLAKTYEVNLNELILHILNKLIDQTNNTAELTVPTTGGNMVNMPSSNGLQSHTSFSSTTSFIGSIPTVSKIIFIIDDIHFADESSLKHLLTLGSHSKSLLILSMKPPRNNQNDGSISNMLQSISTDSHVYLRRLPGLELRYLATLGCQMLCVHRVPSKVVKVFNESCNGIPGFCEQILLDLLRKDKIYIIDEDGEDGDQRHDEDLNLTEGDADKLLLNNRAKIGLFKTLFSRRKQSISVEQRFNERAFSRICVLRNPDENDFNADCQQNFQNYIMCRIDRLSEGESLLVKIAAIIGNTFSRMFLWHLVDPQSKELININSCILEMMQRTIIECAFSKQQITKTRSIKCYCLQNPAGFPSQCRLMAFSHSTIREGIYNSLTDGLKRLLTRNAIDYLEKQRIIVCLTCATSKNDSPFLINEEDGLAEIIRKSQQHALVDIVKMAALKEIDNAIKNLSNLANGSPRQHSNRLSFVPSDIRAIPNENGPICGQESSIKDMDTNRTSIDSNTAVTSKISSTRLGSLEVDNVMNEKQNRLGTNEVSRKNSDDPNITLISVYSPTIPSRLQINVRRSSAASITPKPSQFFSLFQIPKQRTVIKSTSNSELLPATDRVLSDYHADESADQQTTTIEIPKAKVEKAPSCLLSFFQRIFCQCVSVTSNATVTPVMFLATNDSDDNLKAVFSTHATQQVGNLPKENVISSKALSNWKKVRSAVLPALGKGLRAMPSDEKLLEKSILSSYLMEEVAQNIACLNKQVHLTRTFRNLYDQSFTFNIFQSFVQRTDSIQHVFEKKLIQQSNPDLNKFINEFNSYNDSRICECIDYVMTIYVKLVEYHTNLYDMYVKMVDDRHDFLCSKQFDRIMYYRSEICHLLIRSNCLQRLLAEIGNARKFMGKFKTDINYDEDFLYEYQCLVFKYTFDLFHAIVLQRTRAINDSKQLCEENLKELNQICQNKIWEKLSSHADSLATSTAKEKRKQYERSKIFQSKESLMDFNSNSQISTTANADPLNLFMHKYSLEYLLCQYNLLRYDLSLNQSIDSINALIDLQYYMFPLSFSLPCTIILVEYFYCQMNYSQCLTLINEIIQFWWSYVSPREKLEFAKLSCLSLIIELKRGLLGSAIASGYFAKRVLAGYHENIFLINSCIHLTLALIGDMRISNIELIIQHLDYLSEQTMNCYGKLWYYILAIDIGIELGYELLPITNELLDNIAKYRKKLLPGTNERSLALFYSDCTLAQIYARLGLLDMSKIQFHQAIHQIKHDQMHLTNTDFRFKRALLKLVEVQLLHWYHKRANEEETKKQDFLLHHLHEFKNEELTSWNKSRLYIYQAYYDRLVNGYRRAHKFPIDNDLNWETCLHEAEENAIKLDREWIKCLRHSWVHPVSDQLALQENCLAHMEQHHGSKSLVKPHNRHYIRPSITSIKISSRHETKTKNDPDEQSATDNYFRQKFFESRSISNTFYSSHFQLYVLPVRV
ncbi:unnamed protein product [Rotaria socialis]|uniref:Guanylate cyclase domain-containing protein n=1 Tax=Rotaria socialis TaxID=392032 RepID=A0A818DVG3_9BILA|nr:unnamed protein product [Rotaria socialis]CAF4520413.1 unnamed protein product [Rotaria socialis]